MKGPDKRADWIRTFLILIFILLVTRFFTLQVLTGSRYRERSEANCVRRITQSAARGLILDRNRRILVDNRPSYSLFLIPYEYERNPADAAVIASTLGIPDAEIQGRIEEAGTGPFSPVRLTRDASFSTLTRVEESRLDLPGLFFLTEPVRTYPSGASMAHVLGYLGEVSREMLQKESAYALEPGDIMGKSGIERFYDAVLRGTNGYRYSTVDALGRETGNFHGGRDTVPVPGNNVILTLDLDLQAFVEETLAPYQGACIVLDPRNGEILALTSKPDYDLNAFSTRISSTEWERLRTDESTPLMDRTIQGQLPPGSTYKMILALAALQQEGFDPEEKVGCTGTLWIGQRPFHCWRAEGHGPVDLAGAIEGSCNVYFYTLGMAIGVDAWAREGRLMGAGSLTGIDLYGETPGLLPDRKMLNSKYGKGGWTRGMEANLAVGQGDLLVTPIQMAKITALIAKKGRCPVFHVLKSVQSRSSGAWTDAVFKNEYAVRIPADVFSEIHTALYEAVNGENGTGRAAWVEGFHVCGKTGTAQNPRGLPHAWFAGFAPRNDPRVVIVVALENVGTGGGAAAPLAGRILHWMHRSGTVS